MKAKDALEQKRIEENLTGEQFANKLGITPGAWSLIASGDRAIGWRVLAAIREHYPEIYEVALNERLQEAVA